MILNIGQGWSIDTSFTDNGIRWAQLWAPKDLSGPSRSIIDRDGPDSINECLDEFRNIMGMDEDELINWQK